MDSFVRLDKDVMCSVGPQSSAPWSEDLKDGNCSAGMCHFCSSEVVKEKGRDNCIGDRLFIFYNYTALSTFKKDVVDHCNIVTVTGFAVKSC